LILDGTVVRVRLDKKATSISLLVALGVRQDGQKIDLITAAEDEMSVALTCQEIEARETYTRRSTRCKSRGIPAARRRGGDTRMNYKPTTLITGVASPWHSGRTGTRPRFEYRVTFRQAGHVWPVLRNPNLHNGEIEMNPWFKTCGSLVQLLR
jgi:hypothetical protein